MRQYILSRLVQLVPVLLLASVAVFLLIRLIPGDPAHIIAGADATQEQIEAVRRQLGLDRPLPVQYAVWLGNVVRGDLGLTIIGDMPVTRMILTKLPVTIELTIGAMFFALLVALPLGILSAVRPNSFIAKGAFWWNSLAMAVPTFWLGILLVLTFGLQLRLLPTSGYVPFFEDPLKALRFMILPALTLGTSISAVLARFTRAALVETLSQDYVRTARAKGLTERQVVLGHVLKNALIPVVTVLGMQFGAFMGGAVITESIFDYPGMGRMMLHAILSRDYTLLQGSILFIVAMFVVVNLVTDIVYTALDPRIKF